MPIMEGTGKELEQYLHNNPERRYRLMPLAELDVKEGLSSHRYFTDTTQEWSDGLNALAAQNAHLPALPAEAFDRETLYEEIW
jgi:hypothetical protein